MKNRSTFILGILFFFLLIYYLFTSLNPPEISTGSRPIFDGMTPDVDKIEFSSVSQGHIVLERKNEEWFITEPFQYKAYDSSIQSMLNSLFKTVIDIEEIDSDSESHDNYNVGENTGTSFKLYSQGNIILDVIVGRQTQELGHSYVRQNGSDKVELWRGMLSQDVVLKAEDWRDKVLYKFNDLDIISIEAINGSDRRSLTLDGLNWIYKENGEEKPIDMVKAQSIVSLFAGLTCDNFAYGNEIPRAGSKEPDTEVTFTIRNSKKFTLDIWTPDDSSSRYLARKRDGDMLYLMYENKGAKLVLDYEQVR